MVILTELAELAVVVFLSSLGYKIKQLFMIVLDLSLEGMITETGQ